MIPLLCLRNADKDHTVCSAYCQDSVCNEAHIQAAVSFLSGSYIESCVATWWQHVKQQPTI